MEIFTFEQLKSFALDIANEHGLKNISITNESSYNLAGGTFSKTIIINYNLALQQLLGKYSNDVTTINFYLLQLVCHEIIHMEHAEISYNMTRHKEEIKNNAHLTSIYNEMEALKIAQNYPNIYYKKHDTFIDEYIAELLGMFYAADYINKKMPDQFSELEQNKLNRRIAIFIANSYYGITMLRKIKITTPLNRFKKLANGQKIKLDRKILSPVRSFFISQIERDFNDFEINIINPNDNAIKHSEFEKLIYGEDTQLLDVVTDIMVEKIKTTNIFDFLRNYSDDLSKANTENNSNFTK